MPELPEVETVKRVLESWIIDKEIKQVRIRYDKIFENSNEEELNKVLANQKIVRMERYGKYLVFILEKNVIVSHLRMEGKYHFGKENIDFSLSSKEAKHMHAIFDFKDGSSLIYLDVRKFGRLSLHSLNDYKSSSSISKLGKEPFDITNYDEFYQKIIKNKKEIKTVLLDQSVIAGLGNIYVDECLFLANIHPFKKANELSYEEVVNIVKNARIVLNKAIELGGSTIKSYHSGNGVDGRFQNELNVYGKEGEFCPRCKTKIVKTFLHGRGTHFCPSCQQNIPNKKIRVIGITGLIGSGKSTITKLLNKYDVTIADADYISRNALNKGSKCYKKAIEVFSKNILDENNNIDRKILREITSNDKNMMEKLENIIHPYVKEETLKIIKEAKTKYVLLDVPLLFESNMDKLCDLVIFVNCFDKIRIKRLEDRATMPIKDAKNLNNLVIDAKTKIGLANVVIENSSNLENSENQIVNLMTKI